MIAVSIKLNYTLFFVEYFVSIVIIYLLVTYSLLVANIFSIVINKAINDSLSLIFLFTGFLILNDFLFFIIDFNSIGFFDLKKLMLFDYFSVISKLIICFLSSMFFITVSNILKDYKLTSFEFILLLLFNILGLIFLCSSYDLLLIFVSLELVSLSSYFLVSIKKNYYYSIECGIKYLIINTISGSFFLFGSFLFYYNLGVILIPDIYLLSLNIEHLYFSVNNIIFKKLLFKLEYFQYQHYLQFVTSKLWFFEYLLINKYILMNAKPIVELGFLFIILSIIIKLSLSPFYLWSLEIYEKSVSIVTFFLIVLIKLSYFAILYRICFFMLDRNNFIMNSFLLIISFLSIVVGSFGNLRQKKVKTLLVYSSISHIGYVLLAFSVNSFFSLEACYFYLLQYLLSNIIIWFIVLNLIKKQKYYQNKLSKNIGDFMLLNKTNKIFSLGLLIILFSISGIPPFIGFLAKFGIYLVLISEQFFSLILIVSLCSIISTFYYIRLIKIFYFENVRIGILYLPLNSFNVFIFCFFSFTICFLFLNPKFLYLIIHKIIIMGCTF